MSNYIRSIERQKYPRRNELNNYKKRHEKRSLDNGQLTSHKNPKDNSAILKRVINKRYKENIKKNNPYKKLNINTNFNDNDDDYYSNHKNTYDNYDNIDYRDYRFTNPTNYNNRKNSNYNHSSASKYDNSDVNSKYSNYNDNNNINYNNNKYNDIDVNNYRNNLRNKTINLNNYISPKVNDDEDNSSNYDDEFLADYNKRKNIMNEDKTYYFPNSRSLGKKKFKQRILNNRLYNYTTDGNPNNNNDENQPFYLITDSHQMEDYNNIPYNKKKGKEYYLQNTNNYYLDNFLGKDAIVRKRNKRDNYYNYDNNKRFNRSFIAYDNNDNNDDDYSNRYYERSERRRNRSQRHSYKRKVKAYKEKTIKFVNHLSQYFVIYYMNIIKKLFDYLKSQKNKKTNKNNVTSNRKYNKKPIKNNNFPKIKNRVVNPEKFVNKPNKAKEGLSKEKRMPYHKRNIVIDRIKSNNESVSPDKTKCEMYRNINELNKKYDDIYNRKNRMSGNKNKGGNDLSFTSENRSFCRSVEKYKEIFENNMNKERERKKLLEKKEKKDQEEKLKDNNNLEVKKDVNKNLIEELIKKSEELRKNIEKEMQKKKNLKNAKVNKEENGKNNKLSDLEKEKFRKKYGKKNLNNNNNKTNDKYEMVDIKKIMTRDKAIHINIKYLNYIIMNNKNKNKKDKWKYFDICNNCNISLFATKANNGFIPKKIKNEMNDKELTAILEENKVDLSFSDSD